MLLSGFDLVTFLIRMPAVIISIGFHELAHAYMSYKLGDSTARYGGRISLNPLRHIDPVGLIFMLFTGFGWAKPVQVDTRYLREPKRDMALISAAGPFANFILAFVFMLIIFPIVYLTGDGLPDLALTVFRVMIYFNISLGVFNLLPIPPLDGSKILGAFLPINLYYKLLEVERYGFIILILLVYTDSFSGFLSMLVNSVYNLLRFLVEKIYFFL